MKKTGLRIFIITLAIISFLFSTTAEILHELFNSPGSATSEGISIVTNEGKTQEKETQEKETQEKEKEVPGETALEVHFIDVGQADCILIKASTKAFLIDGGGNGTSEAVVKYLKKQGISRFDYVLGSSA